MGSIEQGLQEIHFSGVPRSFEVKLKITQHVSCLLNNTSSGTLKNKHDYCWRNLLFGPRFVTHLNLRGAKLDTLFRHCWPNALGPKQLFPLCFQVWGGRDKSILPQTVRGIPWEKHVLARCVLVLRLTLGNPPQVDTMSLLQGNGHLIAVLEINPKS